jgi:SAM-dependent methyltransferase
LNNNITFLSRPSDVSMADDWYQYASLDHFWMEWRFQIIKIYLNQLMLGHSIEDRFLDIGCGNGQFIKQITNYFDLNIDGCDLNIYALEKFQNKNGNIFIYDLYEKNPKLIRKYKTIFLLDVIEHLIDDRSFILTAKEHVKQNGWIIINVPALPILFSKYDKVAGHYKRYTKNDLVKLFNESGISTYFIGYWGMTLLPLAIIRKLLLSFTDSQKVIRKGFKPPNKIINNMLKALMKLEISLIKNPIIGTSLIAIGKVKD